MLQALTGGGSSQADEAYVRELFDAFADTFDAKLTQVLDYRVPERVSELLGAAPLGTVLDLGCGTGLLAPLLRGRVERLVGVDLSPAMLDKARARGGYDALYAEGLDAYLDRVAKEGEGFDVVVAADVFVYVGALDGVFAAVRRCCRGRFVFTTEVSDEPLELRTSGRYAHSPAAVAALADAHGWTCVHHSLETLRTEGGRPVEGQCVILEPREAT